MGYTNTRLIEIVCEVEGIPSPLALARAEEKIRQAEIDALKRQQVLEKAQAGEWYANKIGSGVMPESVTIEDLQELYHQITTASGFLPPTAYMSQDLYDDLVQMDVSGQL